MSENKRTKKTRQKVELLLGTYAQNLLKQKTRATGIALKDKQGDLILINKDEKNEKEKNKFTEKNNISKDEKEKIIELKEENEEGENEESEIDIFEINLENDFEAKKNKKKK